MGERVIPEIEIIFIAKKFLRNKTRKLVFKIALTVSGMIAVCTKPKCQGRQRVGQGTYTCLGVLEKGSKCPGREEPGRGWRQGASLREKCPFQRPVRAIFCLSRMNKF